MTRSLFAAMLLCAACARDNALVEQDGGLDFVIGGVALRVASGAARSDGDGLTLYLSDQPDTCLAITQEPAGASTRFELAVAPATDGTLAARIGPGSRPPGPGLAVGALATRAAGVETARIEAVQGDVSWKREDDGRTTILTLDVGFDGTDDRLQTGALTIPHCN